MLTMLSFEGGYSCTLPPERAYSLSATALTAIILRRNWIAWQRMAHNSSLSVAVLLRVSIFSFLPMVALA